MQQSSTFGVSFDGSHSRQTVAVLDDDRGMCQSLEFLISSVGIDVEIFDDPKTFLASYDPERHSCLVTDVRMPGMSGIDVQDSLRELGSRIPVVMITGYGEVGSAVRAMKGGAIDFIEKPFTDQELLDRVQDALGRDRRRRVRDREFAEVQALLDKLTRREAEVLDHVVAGKPNKVIAMDLELSPKTVEVHRAHVMEKLKVDSFAALLRLVLTHRDAANRNN